MALLIMLGISVVLVFSLAGKVLYWVWLKPKNLEKYLRQQGIGGSPYKLFRGNLKEIASMSIEARSKPMEISHRITQRVMPFTHQGAEKYGLTMQALQSVYIPGISWFLPTKQNSKMKEVDKEIKTILTYMINKQEEAMKIGKKM
ncbi:Cytochrome p450 [Thalictrum thalictroides]|uniref:Cytochrome p450 n=1 Tax=Thalictrum thalictroides TaxID=46969 RepID=A0A7J6W1R9_THATH|nr:Cytochrome p450 [Thalictrum thalictroides]